MKDEINLLPSAASKERTLWLYNKRFNRMYTVAIVGVVVIAGTYGGLFWFYQQSLSSLNSEIQSVNTQDESIEKEVRDINRLLGGITERTMKESWTPRIDDLLVQVPSDISVSDIELRTPQSLVEGTADKLVLTGQSQSRSSIVEYERQLRALPWVEDIDAPLQNLASGPQVQFSFTILRKTQIPSVTPAPGGQP